MMLLLTMSDMIHENDDEAPIFNDDGSDDDDERDIDA